MRKKSPPRNLQPKNLWFLFACFTLVNGLLAFSPLPDGWKIALALGGLGLPAFLVFKKAGDPPAKPFWQGELLTLPPGWFFPLVILAAAAFRFTHLTTLSLWPLTDEAKSGYFAMQLAARGPEAARLLYDFSQLPPLYIWLEGLFFKLFGTSLFSLWCFPALLSLLTVPVFYAGARQHFSKSFALLLLGLMAFTFWPLYTGRFSHQGSLLLLWECLVFWMAGKLNRGTPAPFRSGFYLGLLAGGGFYTFTSWPSVALVLTLWVFCFYRRYLVQFFGGMVLVYLPLGFAWLHHNYGGYIQHVWALNPNEPWWPQLIRGFWDMGNLFWRTPDPPNLFAYKPFWGGYLNPILGACFFLGALVFLRQGPASRIKFWTSAFLLFYLPGFLTGGVEMFRILPILPLLLAGVALGISALLSSLKSTWRWPALCLFLLVSLGLDGTHLFGVYQGVWAHPVDNWFASKSLDRLRVYQVLEDFQKGRGPGLILSDLVPDLYDQSLSLATFEFNAEENPRLDPAQAHWVALLINVNYQPYLTRQFAGVHCIPLTLDMGWPDGGLMLALFPLAGPLSEALERMVRADKAMQGLVPLVFDCRDYRPRQPVVDELKSLHSLFQGDPFLESCFWEKIADNAYGDRNYTAQVEALQQAIEKGYPAAHLYNDLGALYFRRGHLEEARAVFEQALRCPLNYTSAAAGLQLLEEAEKAGRLPQD